MTLVYPIKIKYKDGIIVGLISPHLRMDFLTKYKELSPTASTLSAERLVVRDLQITIEDYVRWVQDNNYVIRPPIHSQIMASQQDEQWINVDVNIPITSGPFEFLGKIVGIFLFLATSALDEFFFILGARLNKIPYTTLILPVLADFMMAGIIYAYSGAASNIMAKGRELDDWWYHKKLSPTETEIEKSYPLCSSWYLSKLLLCILPIAHTIFKSFGYWQNMMSMRYKVEGSNLDDPIITPKFIYNLAIVGTTIGAMYNAAQHTSFALKGTGILKVMLDNCYTICRKKLNSIKGNNYFEVLANDEQIESEIKIDSIHTSTSVVLVSSSDVTNQLEREEKGSLELTVFLITDIRYNNLLIKQDLLHEARKIGGIKAVQNIINLGENTEVASLIIEYIEQYGIKHVVNVLFGDTTKNYKVEIDSSSTEIIAMAADNQKNSESSVLLEIEKIINIQAIANNFDKETLLKILELVRNHDIAERIVSEATSQGIDRVVYTLLEKEFQVAGDTNNLESIIGIDAVNELRLVPNGILNSCSNRIYEKVVSYINDLAKSLDDMLNAGKSGNQVAITIALLEELLGLAASGQKFISGRPPYYDPNSDDDWPNGGGGGGSYSESNSSENNFNGYTGLILPLYNGTAYNIIDHQM